MAALTLTLFRGQRVALVGHNGCGKSTLLKLLAGTLERCGGNVVTASQIRMGYYTQHQMDTLRGRYHCAWRDPPSFRSAPRKKS